MLKFHSCERSKDLSKSDQSSKRCVRLEVIKDENRTQIPKAETPRTIRERGDNVDLVQNDDLAKLWSRPSDDHHEIDENDSLRKKKLIGRG
jgi:hypothetical protein